MSKIQPEIHFGRTTNHFYMIMVSIHRFFVVVVFLIERYKVILGTKYAKPCGTNFKRIR